MARGWGAATGGTTGIRLGPNNYFKPGTWSAQCWTCGRWCKADEMQKLSVYDGNGWVCRLCFELPNPQEFVRGIPDRQNVPWTQPTPPPNFITGSADSEQVKGNGDMFGQPMFGQSMLG
jgi:hypothetical protein